MSLNENMAWLPRSHSAHTHVFPTHPIAFLVNTQQLLVDHRKVLLIGLCYKNSDAYAAVIYR